jgi:chorismate mutase
MKAEDAPHEDAQVAKEAAGAGGGRDHLRVLRERVEIAEAKAERYRTAWWSARIGRAKARAGFRFRVRLSEEPLLERALAAEAERDQLDIRIDEITTTYQRVNGLHQIGQEGNHCTTCRRTYPCPTVKALDNIDDRASMVITERDQLKAAVARVRALAHANAGRADCGAGWLLDPAAVLAALDQPEGA